MANDKIRVAFLLADYGHDPTETAIPFRAFKEAGFAITILTETGAVPECDRLMLQGWTQKLLGADAAAVAAYHAMTRSPEWARPAAWTALTASATTAEAAATTTSSPSPLADRFDLVFLPGGHDKGVRQLLDSAAAQALLAGYFPRTARAQQQQQGSGSGSADAKVCAAICHGVQALAHARSPEGMSVLHDVATTALPASFETAAYQGTRVLLGDYYKTYGAGTANVEKVVRGVMDDAGKQWKSSSNPGKPLVVEDEKYYYLSGRWPGDAQLLAQKTIEMVKKARGV